MPVTNTPYGAQWRCTIEVRRQRGSAETDTCNANGLASDRDKAQQALEKHIRTEHRR